MWVVIMFEPNVGSENLDAKGQLNEVFGPFHSEEEADQWTAAMIEHYKPGTREFLIIPMSDKSIINALDTSRN